MWRELYVECRERWDCLDYEQRQLVLVGLTVLCSILTTMLETDKVIKVKVIQ